MCVPPKSINRHPSTALRNTDFKTGLSPLISCVTFDGLHNLSVLGQILSRAVKETASRGRPCSVAPRLAEAESEGRTRGAAGVHCRGGESREQKEGGRGRGSGAHNPHRPLPPGGAPLPHQPSPPVGKASKVIRIKSFSLY